MKDFVNDVVMKLTLFVLVFRLKPCGGNVININASVGRGINFTLFIINDNVTWYSAVELCEQEVPGSTFEMCGYTCAQFLAKTIDRANENKSVGNLFWVSRIKEVDDIIYKLSSCQQDLQFTRNLQKDDLNGEISCVALSINQPIVSAFVTDNCLKKHPYICLRYNQVSHEYTSRPFYTNVSVSVDEDLISIYNGYNTTLDKCDNGCDAWFRCLGYTHDNETGTCMKYLDSSIGGYVDFQVRNSSVTSVYSVSRFKFGTRVFYEWFTPTVSMSDHQAPERSCNIKTSTQVSTSSTGIRHTSKTPMPTSTPDCRCICYSNQSSINSTELAEMVANLTSLLTVNKKTLSSYTRQLKSAEDSRLSSKFFGAVGIIVIITVVFLIGVGDVMTFGMYLQKRASKYFL